MGSGNAMVFFLASIAEVKEAKSQPQKQTRWTCDYMCSQGYIWWNMMEVWWNPGKKRVSNVIIYYSCEVWKAL
jgi:hypothetical protein